MAELDPLAPENALFQPEGRAVWVAPGLKYRALYERERKAQAEIDRLESRGIEDMQARLEAAEKLAKQVESALSSPRYAAPEIFAEVAVLAMRRIDAALSDFRKEVTDEPA